LGIDGILRVLRRWDGTHWGDLRSRIGNWNLDSLNQMAAIRREVDQPGKEGRRGERLVNQT
jgi:hypothetical protein